MGLQQDVIIVALYIVYNKSCSPEVTVRSELTPKERILNPTNWQIQEFHLFWYNDSKLLTINVLPSNLLVNQKQSESFMKLQEERAPVKHILLSSSKHSKLQIENSFWLIFSILNTVSINYL